MGKALLLAIGGLLTGFLNVLSRDRLKTGVLWFAKCLLDLAVERLPEDQRERFAEEWTSHLNEVQGDIAKVLFAWGCVAAAREMASLLKYGKPARKHVLKVLAMFSQSGSPATSLAV